MEHTRSLGNSVSSDSVVNRSYTNLFPFISLSTSIDTDHSVSFSVTRRLNRPSYSALNPARYFFDKYSYYQGNPFTTPEFSWNTSLGYTFKNKYILTMSYVSITDPIMSFVQINNATAELRTSTYNFEKRTQFDALFIVPFKFNSWWDVENTINLYFTKYNLPMQGASFQVSKAVADLSTTHTFSLPYKARAEISILYTSPSLDGLYLIRHYFTASSGVKKTFFKDKMDFKVAVTDIFKTICWWGYSLDPTTNLRYNHTGDTRRVNVSMTYHFGGKLSERKTNKLEEQDRLN